MDRDLDSVAGAEAHTLGTRELLPACSTQLWRVQSGALRVDSAPAGEAPRFVRLAFPGDVVGVEQWAGTDDRLTIHALMPTRLLPVRATTDQMMHILMETVVVAHQRSREAMTLRSGPVAQRVKNLLLMFAQGSEATECSLPHLVDMSDIVDAAPETVSRVFASLRQMDMLQDRQPQKARFGSRVLRELEVVAGMSGAPGVRKLQPAGA